MSTLDVTRADLALIVLYLNKTEARDKICRAIQYGSKFLSNGQPGTAQDVDKSTSLARKVFRLFKFVNDLHALISPPSEGTPLPLILLGKSKNMLLSTFLLLDQVVWAGRTGIYKKNEQYLSKVKQSNDRLLSLIKSSMDIVVAVGLLQLAPETVTPRVTGAFGFITSLISCYQLLPASHKAKMQ
ncbi:Peroxisomal biogenesis factor 11 protein [Dioscorea alata]|uniref:Peroxisomal biogenesis factor 11 protein n=2 Tax=Dioscorea alata TaxID=55571 RepID=A0ACB7WUM0_DIOAL|nr:Peroxisomal biogenesis factor 11 protein [Dioscorea alata]KAH7692413.1 Peroxisomal biogenesis factor 11 protein [Dioscorea alata]